MNSPFPSGAVSLSFDDGWKCIYDNALPLLTDVGFTSTHYIISGCLDDEQFPRYMNVNHIKNLQKLGHEIGCHTASHKRLTEESPSIIKEEVELSLQYLKRLSLQVETFAYPFGLYNEEIINVVSQAGFIGARSIIEGYNDQTTHPWLLKCQTVIASTQPTEVYYWIDKVRRSKQWLILVFHQVDYEGRACSTIPEKLSKIIRYLRDTRTSVITVCQGIKQIKI